MQLAEGGPESIRVSDSLRPGSTFRSGLASMCPTRDLRESLRLRTGWGAVAGLGSFHRHSSTMGEGKGLQC